MVKTAVVDDGPVELLGVGLDDFVGGFGDHAGDFAVLEVD